ncbi:hypothetical protein [uncultured Campylobacter sp.]|uniref:hypothetical protein n=1 Tax=uncultured Campylobacter sp. TaxID=218934 RepID=UPI0026141F6F|nr:hypothetical protein [uncultured Campylobacter sp.]
MARYPAACAAKPPMCENKIRAARQRCNDRTARQKTMRGRAMCFLKGGATIGAVRHGRDARFEPRAADEACTAHVNANKF